MTETIRHLTSSGCQINGMQTVTDHVPIQVDVGYTI